MKRLSRQKPLGKRMYRKADLKFEQMVMRMKDYVLQASGCSSPREMVTDLAKAVIADHSECLGDVKALMDELVDDLARLMHCVGRAAVDNVDYFASVLKQADDADDYLEQVEMQAIAELTQDVNTVDAMKMFENTERIARKRCRLMRI